MIAAGQRHRSLARPIPAESWSFDWLKAEELGLKAQSAVLLAGLKQDRRIIIPEQSEFVGLMLLKRDDEFTANTAKKNV